MGKGKTGVRLLLIAPGVLPACSSFGIDQPDPVISANPMELTITGRDNLRNLMVIADANNDVTGQFKRKALDTDVAEGSLNLSTGFHTITASGTVDCWYCTPTPWSGTATR